MPQPACPVATHVPAGHGSHALLTHRSSVAHVAHTLLIPHPKSTAPHPVTRLLVMASAHVIGVQHPPSSHTSLFAQVEHVDFTPQPNGMGPHAVMPAARASAQVKGVQHPPSEQVSLVSHVPHDTAGPHPLLALPHVAAPHVGGVHAVQAPLTHLVAPEHPEQVTWALPHALGMVPHRPAPSAHSGGGAAHMPPVHEVPASQVHALV